jgi:hypothetical protein
MIDEPEAAPQLRETHNYVPWVTVLLGLAVFTLRYASPRGTFDVHWNLFVTGIVVMFAALATTIAHGQSRRNYWSVINIAAGGWLIASATFIPSIPPVTTGQIVIGAATVVSACASVAAEVAYARHAASHHAPV